MEIKWKKSEIAFLVFLGIASLSSLNLGRWFENYLICDGNRLSPLIPFSAAFIYGCFKMMPGIFNYVFLAFTVFKGRNGLTTKTATLVMFLFATLLYISYLQYSSGYERFTRRLSTEEHVVRSNKARCEFIEEYRS